MSQDYYNKKRNAYDDYTVYGRISDAAPVEHTVEDARTDRSRTIQKEKAEPRVSKNNAIKKKGFTLVIAITVLCFSLTVVAADLFSGNANLSSYASLFTRKKNEIKYDSYYLVYATHDSDMGVGYKNAAVIRKEGGAGYVMKVEEEYYVFLCAYEKKEDAEKIAKTQANYGVYELNLYSFDSKKQTDLKAAAGSAELYREVFRTLYDVAISVQRNIFLKEDVQAALTPIKEKIQAAEESFRAGSEKSTSNAVLDYNVLLRSMRASIENILTAEQDYLPLLRYYAISVLHSQALFREKYFSF